MQDTLKVSGVQVSPKEIEDVLFAHPEKLISDVTVAGVSGGRTDDEKVPRAWIVLSSAGKKKGAPAVIKALEKWHQESLSKYKWLRGGFEVVKTVRVASLLSQNSATLWFGWTHAGRYRSRRVRLGRRCEGCCRINTNSARRRRRRNSESTPSGLAKAVSLMRKAHIHKLYEDCDRIGSIIKIPCLMTPLDPSGNLYGLLRVCILFWFFMLPDDASKVFPSPPNDLPLQVEHIFVSTFVQACVPHSLGM
jgi:hypothetical protein